jgi:hypothetical protein
MPSAETSQGLTLSDPYQFKGGIEGSTVIDITDEDGCIVALVLPAYFNRGGKLFEYDNRQKANAHLLGAALALQDALEAALGVVEWALDNGANPGVTAVYKMGQAALAKSWGETTDTDKDSANV